MQERVEWWKQAVVYQIYPRSFYDSNGDGVGDLRGILQKLDYLGDDTENSLGIDAIWLNPVYPSPQYDFGYEIMDHRNIDPQYGTLADFDLLVREAHQRGIRIIMDFVPSITSHLHPWFIESRSDKSNPKRDWYFWKPAPKPGKYPNNWLGVFGGRAWTWDSKTQEYYYHDSLPEQPDLNWRNPEVEKAMLANMAFWYERGVDGFRIDVLNYVFKDELFRSNPYCLGRRPYDMQRHLYDKDQPEAVEVGKKMRALAEQYGGKMLVAEIYIDDPEEAARYLGEGDGVHMAFNFSFMFSPFSAARFKQEVTDWERAVGTRGWPAYFLSNHDNPRHISRYARGRWTLPRARVAAAMLLTLRGTPFLYMGEEIGMRNVRIPRGELLDPVGRKYWPFHPGRDGARTPMQWNGGRHAGFSSVKPWLRVHPEFERVNVEVEREDRDSLLAFYKRLIRIRRNSPALQTGDYQVCPDTPAGVFAYVRTAEDRSVLVALNFTQGWKRFALKVHGASSGRKLLAYPETSGDATHLHNIELPPYGVLLSALDQ